jgi:hypothetical protein
MVPDLEAARKDGWRHFVAADESWFSFHLAFVVLDLARDEVAIKPGLISKARSSCS